MHWEYKTNVGTFWIKPNKRGMVTLGVGDDALGNYKTPEMAAGVRPVIGPGISS